MRLMFEDHDNPTLLSGGGTATFIACDTCGLKIQGQEEGIVVFHMRPDGRKRGDFAVIHKGRCETEETKRGRWQDLAIFLRDIVLNSQIDLAAAEARVSGPDGLASWGLHT